MKGKNILIGITASIAAYKAYDLIRYLQKHGASVRCMVTPEGMQFVNKMTLQALLQDEVYSDLFADYAQKRAVHIDLSEWADALCIVPATADALAKTAVGIADNVLLATLLATQAKILFAPAMHSNMWVHPATQSNIDTLKARGAEIVVPATGTLSDGTEGVGHIASLDDIVQAIATLLP